MAVIVELIVPGLSRQDYDRLRTIVDWHTLPPAGGMVHLSWWNGEQCHNVDAWEDEESLDAFITERLNPAMAQLGISIEPQLTLYAAHEVFAPRKVRQI